jgi:outer membrane autotransporter protein
VIVHAGLELIERSGWNVGVGAEYMIAPQWSVKAEYNYLDFGKDNTAHFVADTRPLFSRLAQITR